MKKFVLKELKDFLDVADNLETPFKFYFDYGNELEAIVHLRTFLISWRGESGEERKKLLREHGFKEAEEEETRKVVLEELI